MTFQGHCSVLWSSLVVLLSVLDLYNSEHYRSYVARGILCKFELSIHKVKYIQGVPGGSVIFWEFILLVILSKQVYMFSHSKQTSVYVRVPFQMVSKIELFHCRVAKLLIKRYYIVYNMGIYCSSDKVGTVYLVQCIFENSTVDISALCSWCEDMVYCSSECILTFLFAGVNIHNEIEQFISFIYVCMYIYMCFQEEKSLWLDQISSNISTG